MNPCPFCSILTDRVWTESEHAIAFAADAPAAEGHIVVVPKEHVPSIHALPIAAQKGVVFRVRGARRPCAPGLCRMRGFAIGEEMKARYFALSIISA